MSSWAVDKLHAAGIPYMNMIGAPKHVEKALAAGADIICAQGGEGGGHTGDVATSILIPVVVDLCKGRRSALTNAPVAVVAAGGIFDGRGLAMALAFGAQAVWVGTRFICATEAGAPPRHQQAVIDAGYHDTVRTVIFTGRPMRVVKNPYIMHWEENRQQEIRELCDNGIIPYTADLEEKPKPAGDGSGKLDADIPESQAGAAATFRPLLMGQCAGAIKDIQPAKQIVDEMVAGAVHAIRTANAFIAPKAKL
jgi:NAD(P)H-dependent flavin oxidoreductase YrpB (nitropropane dioxygenase family)